MRTHVWVHVCAHKLVSSLRTQSEKLISQGNPLNMNGHNIVLYLAVQYASSAIINEIPELEEAEWW